MWPLLGSGQCPESCPKAGLGTWHSDPGEGLRLAQRVYLNMPERLTLGALLVPVTRVGGGEGTVGRRVQGQATVLSLRGEVQPQAHWWEDGGQGHRASILP